MVSQHRPPTSPTEREQVSASSFRAAAIDLRVSDNRHRQRKTFNT